MPPNWLKDTSLYALLLLLAASIGSTTHAALLLPSLPNPMATHFDTSGQPNGYSSPQSFIGLWIGLTWGLAAVFGPSVFLPRAPLDYLSLPGKEELNAAGRLIPLLKTIAVMLIVDGTLIIAVLWAIFATTAIANLSRPVLLPVGAVIGPVIAIIAAEVLVVGGILHMTMRERRKAREGPRTDPDDSALIRPSS